MKMYNILGVMKGLNDNAKAEQLNESVKQPTVYENVEPRGSITEAVKSLESKFGAFKEGIEDKIEAAREKAAAKGKIKDKEKEEPKSASRFVKGKAYGGSAQKDADEKDDLDEAAKPDFLDVDKDGNKKEPFKKAVNDKKAVKEGQGPYELYNPKHPKFKANYDKWMAKNPGKKLADFIEAMKKREHGLNESSEEEQLEHYHELIKQGMDPDEAEMVAFNDEVDEDFGIGAGIATGALAGAAIGKTAGFYRDAKSNEKAGYAKPRGRLERLKGALKGVTGPEYGDQDEVRKENPNWIYEKELDEKAPPGAKAERMVKHIKKGYAKDGKLTNKEKAIAYATTWAAHKKGQVEENVQFGDTIRNSTPSWKKAKPMKIKESRMIREGDYYYESIGKALAEKNPNLDTAGSDFVAAVRQEMVAQGMKPNQARNILMMDEDFLMDVATSYGHYCKDLAECGVPMNSLLGGAEELDEIAKLAGLPTKQASCESCGMLESSCSCVHEEDELLPDPPAEINIDMKSLPKPEKELDEREQFQSMPKTTAPTPAAPAAKPGVSYDKSKLNPMREEEVEEGNEFSGALAKAKATGAKEFEVDGKKYTVKEDINVNITANGQEDALNLFRKLAGMPEVNTEPMVQNADGTEVPLRNIPTLELPQDAESAIEQGVVEERDIEYTNTPNEKIGGIETAIPSGDGDDRAKKMYSKEYMGDNHMAVKEEALWKAYESMIKDVKQ